LLVLFGGEVVATGTLAEVVIAELVQRV